MNWPIRLIPCPTEQDWEQVLNLLSSQGYKWASGVDAFRETKFPTHYKGKVCIAIGFYPEKPKGLCYSHGEYFKRETAGNVTFLQIQDIEEINDLEEK
jgi:hypothetical protein